MAAVIRIIFLISSILVANATYHQAPTNGQSSGGNSNSNNGGTQQRVSSYQAAGAGNDGAQGDQGTSLPDILFVVPVFEKPSDKVDVNGLSSGYSPLRLSQGSGTSSNGNGQTSQGNGYLQSQPSNGQFGYEPTNSGSGSPASSQGYGSTNGGGQNGYGSAQPVPGSPQNGYSPAPPPPPTNPQNGYGHVQPTPTNPQNGYGSAQPPPPNPQNGYASAQPNPNNPQNGYSPVQRFPTGPNGNSHIVNPPVNPQNGYSHMQPIPTNPQNGYGPAQTMPAMRQNGYGVAQPAPSTQQNGYGPAPPAPTSPQNGYGSPSQPVNMYGPSPNTPTPSNSGYSMQTTENQVPQDIFVGPYSAAMSAMMAQRGYGNTNNQNNMGGSSNGYTIQVQAPSQGTTGYGSQSAFINMMRNQMQRVNGYGSAQQQTQSQRRPAPGYSMLPAQNPTNGNGNGGDNSEDSNGQRTVIKVALKPILAAGYATKYPEVSYTILRTEGNKQANTDSQAPNNGYPQIQQSQGYSVQTASPQRQQNQGYSVQTASPQRHQNQGYSVQTASPQTQQNQGYSVQTASTQTQQSPDYPFQAPDSVQTSAFGSYGSSANSNSGFGNSYGDSSYGQSAVVNVCENDVNLEGFCTNRKAGLYSHPDPQCFLQCDHTGRHTASMCAPGTMWEKAQFEPSKTNRCVHGSNLGQGLY